MSAAATTFLLAFRVAASQTDVGSFVSCFRFLGPVVWKFAQGSESVILCHGLAQHFVGGRPRLGGLTPRTGASLCANIELAVLLVGDHLMDKAPQKVIQALHPNNALLVDVKVRMPEDEISIHVDHAQYSAAKASPPHMSAPVLLHGQGALSEVIVNVNGRKAVEQLLNHIRPFDLLVVFDGVRNAIFTFCYSMPRPPTHGAYKYVSEYMYG